MSVSPQLRVRVHRALLLAVLLGVVGLALTGWPASSAQASCVGPRLAVGTTVPDGQPAAPATVSRTAPITVAGEWFHDGCADTMSSHGCAPPTPDDPESPMLGVELHLIQNGTSWVLASSDAAGADTRYAISWTSALPAGVVAGAASLTAGTAELSITMVGE